MDKDHTGMEVPGEDGEKEEARGQTQGEVGSTADRSGDLGGKNLTSWAKVRIAAQAVIITVAVLFVASLIWKNWAPFGANVRYEIEVGGESGFVTLPSPLTPSAVAGEDGNGLLYQVEELVMSTEQVRFKLKMPYDSLSRLAFEIEYGGDPDELILGVVNPVGNQLISRPVHNRSLNDLGWSMVSEDAATLFQRTPVYPDVDAFLGTFRGSGDDTFGRTGNKVATYYYELEPAYPDVDLGIADRETFIDHSFRGKHVISTYVKEAPLSIGFDWLDINWSDGPDQLSVFVYAGEDVIHAESLPDDGDLSASQVPSAPRRFELFLPDLAEGAYRVEINCGNDVVFSGIGSAQNYLCFLDSVFLADHPMYGMAAKSSTLFTDGRRLNAQTWHVEGIQTITINGDEELALARENISYSAEMSGDVNEITTQAGSLMLSSRGAYFSFSADSLFFPITSTPYSRLFPVSDFNYVIADYRIPEPEGDGWRQEVAFDLEGVVFADRTIEVILIVPGLSSGAPVTLNSITAVGDK